MSESNFPQEIPEEYKKALEDKFPEMPGELRREKFQAPMHYGWVCPICGRGLSPFTSMCPCQGYPEPKIIC